LTIFNVHQDTKYIHMYNTYTKTIEYIIYRYVRTFFT